MANSVDIKLVVKNLVNGTLDSQLCRICLLPLGVYSVNIFNTICSENKEYTIANVLEELCHIQFTEPDDSKICSNCVNAACNAYKFHMLAKRSNAIINFYVEEIEQYVLSVEIPEQETNNSLCIRTRHFDHVDGVDKSCIVMDNSELTAKRMKMEEVTKKTESYDLEDNVLVISEQGKSETYYRRQGNQYVPISERNAKLCDGETKKIRKKRKQMVYTKCSKCPVKYRFLSKLKEHMKFSHDIELLICMVCKEIFEDEARFEEHITNHPEKIYRCEECNCMFMKYEAMVAHTKWHKVMSNGNEGVHICEVCGAFLTNDDELKTHYDKKHFKKYNCFYCGRMYRAKHSLEIHIKKHEKHTVTNRNDGKAKPPAKSKQRAVNPKDVGSLMCSTCGKNFVDERSLMWHTMLHTNERPFICDTCGRGFISLNRRNQHALCAHSAPTRRCPLCPALFHLRSMVNSHVKKVHLNAHKRSNRASKHQNVSWKTEPVPIQELSVSVQNELLEMQTRNNEEYFDEGLRS